MELKKKKGSISAFKDAKERNNNMRHFEQTLQYLDDQEIPIELHPLHSMWVVDLQQQVYYYHQNHLVIRKRIFLLGFGSKG